MAFIRCSFAVAVATLALSGAAARRTASDAALFEQFKRKYNKAYADPTGEALRFATFCANARRAKKLSAANPHASFSVLTPFADVAEVEFAPRHSGAMAVDDIAKSTAAPSRPEVVRTALVVGARDWRRHGAVTSVKDQGKCGACWAFATAGSIEGQWAVAGHNVTSLSAQELVSCDYTNHGCAAGYITKALDYIVNQRAGLIATDGSYPYTAGRGDNRRCNTTGTSSGARVHGFKFIPRNETEMVAFVAHSGPLAVIIDASTLQSYHGGVITNCPDGAVGHAVLVVGFDLNAAVPYWIVKNSWGPAWGEAGYFRLQYGTDQCSITSNPTTAIVPPRSGNAPSSLPPPPPPPATPVPTPAPSLRQGQFRELRCPDSTCSDRCEITTYKQGAAGCVSYGAGYSADYVCVPGGMQERVYSGLTCGGSPVATSRRATDECVMNNNGVHLMRVCPVGGGAQTPAPSAPWTPTPVSPWTSAPGTPPVPTPTPTSPSIGSYTERQCSDTKCSQSCWSFTYPAGICGLAAGNASEMARCEPPYLMQYRWEGSGCSGAPSYTGKAPLDQCLTNGQQSWTIRC